MSAPTLEDAILAFNKRKEASGMASGDAHPGLEHMTMFVGTGINVDELDRLLPLVGRGLWRVLKDAADDAPIALASAWTDGLVTGILFAELTAAADRAGE